VRHRWILAAVLMAPFCVQIDYFAMNLALPRMAIDLNSTATDLQWVISVYMLALGAFMVPAIGLAYGIAGLGNAAGPLIGGLLTETVGWRWIFWRRGWCSSGHRRAQRWAACWRDDLQPVGRPCV
jgi:MFS family permease